MKNEEISHIAKKIEILNEWCDENIEEYHRPGLSQILKLLTDLEKVEIKETQILKLLTDLEKVEIKEKWKKAT